MATSYIAERFILVYAFALYLQTKYSYTFLTVHYLTSVSWFSFVPLGKCTLIQASTVSFNTLTITIILPFDSTTSVQMKSVVT